MLHLVRWSVLRPVRHPVRHSMHLSRRRPMGLRFPALHLVL